MHPEAITSKQREVLRRLPVPPRFYLVGGTALALQIGHRISVDFDFFITGTKLPDDIFSLAQAQFPKEPFSILVNREGQLTFRVQGVEVTYFAYPFVPLFPFVSYQGIHMYTKQEIAISKAYALGRRATFKDYVDLYFLLKEKHISLKQIIELAGKKYKDVFDPRLFLEQLVYLEDVPSMRIKFLRGRVSREEIKQYFEKEVSMVRL